MKGPVIKWLIPLLLLLLLAGCHREQDYLSVSPHVEQQIGGADNGETERPPVAGNRLELRGAILTLLENWKEQGTVLIRDYEGELEQDLEEAMDYATRQHPTGAYAVDYADSEILEEEGQTYVQISIVFRRSLSEIHSIVLVDDNEAAYDKVLVALENFSNSLTLRIRHYRDEDIMGKIEGLCLEHPRTVPCIPVYSVKLYPDEGEHRILELHFAYPESKESMRSKLSELQTIFNSAKKHGAMGSTLHGKVSLLYRYLARRNCTLTDPEPALPVYSLLSDGLAHDSSLSMIYRELCENNGADCYIVTGTKNGRTYYWNYLQIEDETFYVDLRRGLELRQRDMVPLYDEDLLAEGYEWDLSLYSAPKPQEETLPTDPGETTSEADGQTDPPTTDPATEPLPTESQAPTETTTSTEATEPTTDTEPPTGSDTPTESESTPNES